MLEESGDEVIAESDNAVEVLELIRRFTPDVLLLDHALRSGTGLDVIAAIEADDALTCRVVLFSSYVDASQIQQTATITAVDKPDFARLEIVLDEIRTGGSTGDTTNRRRAPSRPIDHLPGRGDDDDPLKFFAVLGDSTTGDTLLAISVDAASPEVLEAIATEARKTIRAQDWLVVRSRFVAMLLVGGTPDAGASVAGRIRRGWATTEHTAHDLHFASAVLRDDDVPSDVFLRMAAMVDSGT
jgi:CheY-like chemotaxis protein